MVEATRVGVCNRTTYLTRHRSCCNWVVSTRDESRWKTYAIPLCYGVVYPHRSLLWLRPLTNISKGRHASIHALEWLSDVKYAHTLPMHKIDVRNQLLIQRLS